MSALPQLALHVAAGDAGTTHYADSPSFYDFEPGKALFLSYQLKATRVVATTTGTCTVYARVFWYSDETSASYISGVLDETVVNTPFDFQLKRMRVTPPAGATRGIMRVQVTPAASPMQHSVWIKKVRLGKTELFATEGADFWSNVTGRPEGDQVVDDFSYADDAAFLNRWTNYSGAGERTFGLLDSSVPGGKFVRIGNNLGDDQNWLIYNGDPLPFDPDALYEVEFRVRQAVGTGACCLGLTGLQADKTTLVNAVGSNSISSQHYVAKSGGNLNSTWTTYKGYVRGHGATSGSAGVKSDPSSPGQMHSATVYIAPLVLVNFSNVAGEADVAFVRVRKIDHRWGDLLTTPNNLSALTGSEGIQNTLVQINANGTLSGAGSGAVLLGSDGLGYLGDLDAQRNNRINISNGALSGIGPGSGTVVANTSITINSGGVLNGIGSGTGAEVNNTTMRIASDSLGIGGRIRSILQRASGAATVNAIDHPDGVQNMIVQINANGTLSGAGSGRVELGAGGLGYLGDLDATYGASPLVLAMQGQNNRGNLILDPNFSSADSSGTPLWTLSGASAVFTGTNDVKVTDSKLAGGLGAIRAVRGASPPPAGGSNWVFYPSLSTVNGNRYFGMIEVPIGTRALRFALDAIIKAGYTGYPVVYIHFYDGAGTIIAPNFTYNAFGDYRTTANGATDQLKEWGQSIDVPAGAKYARLSVLEFGSSALVNAGSALFANPSITQAANWVTDVTGAAKPSDYAGTTLARPYIVGSDDHSWFEDRGNWWLRNNSSGWDNLMISQEKFDGACSASFRNGGWDGTSSTTTMSGLIDEDNPTLTAGSAYTALDYCFYTFSTNINIYESGASIANVKAGANGSEQLLITYDGTKIRYYIDGVVVRTVTTTANRKFRFAVCPHTNTIYNGAVVSGAKDILFQQGAITPQAGATLVDSVGTVLQDSGTNGIRNNQITINANGSLSGAGAGSVSIRGIGYAGDLNAGSALALVPIGQTTMFELTGNRIKQTEAGSSWTKWAYTREPFVGGAVASAVAVSAGRFIFGLTDDPTNNVYAAIDYGLYIGDGIIYYMEIGTYASTGYTVAAGDCLSVVYEGTTVRYFKNDTLIRTVTGVAAGRSFRAKYGTDSTGTEWSDLRAAPFTDSARTYRHDSNGRSVDGRARTSNVNFGLRSVYNPPTLTGSDAGTTASIAIGACSYNTDWGTTVSFPSANLTGLAFSTKYFIWRNQADPETAGESYGYSTSLSAALGVGKVYLGTCTTPADGGTSTGGITPGSTDCVATDAFVLVDGEPVWADSVQSGDHLTILDEESWDGVTSERVQRIRLADQECVRLTTESGIQLTLSLDTPITLRNRMTTTAANAWQGEVPVLDRGEFRWERVVAIEDAGVRTVARISVHERTYAAGDQRDRYILTHNSTKP